MVTKGVEVNTWLYEDVDEFKKIDKKYNERFAKDRKNWIENEASLLDLKYCMLLQILGPP